MRLRCRNRFGTGAADAVVFRFFLADVGFALGLDARQFQFVAEDGGQFFERHFDFENVRAGIAACFSFAVPFLSAAAGDRLADFAVSLPDAAGAVLAIAEMRHIELRQRNADQIAPFTADHLAVRNVFTQVLANFPPHNLAEAAMIVVDVEGHVAKSAASVWIAQTV